MGKSCNRPQKQKHTYKKKKMIQKRLQSVQKDSDNVRLCATWSRKIKSHTFGNFESLQVLRFTIF